MGEAQLHLVRQGRAQRLCCRLPVIRRRRGTRVLQRHLEFVGRSWTPVRARYRPQNDRVAHAHGGGGPSPPRRSATGRGAPSRRSSRGRRRAVSDESLRRSAPNSRRCWRSPVLRRVTTRSTTRPQNTADSTACALATSGPLPRQAASRRSSSATAPPKFGPFRAKLNRALTRDAFRINMHLCPTYCSRLAFQTRSPNGPGLRPLARPKRRPHGFGGYFCASTAVAASLRGSFRHGAPIHASTSSTRGTPISFWSMSTTSPRPVPSGVFLLGPGTARPLESPSCAHGGKTKNRSSQTRRSFDSSLPAVPTLGDSRDQSSTRRRSPWR